MAIVRRARTPDPRVCSIDAALKVIGEKWALLAIREIAFGNHRFDEMVFNTGAPRDVLATRLKALVAAGVIAQERYEERPPRYEYVLSEAGEQLFGLLHVIRDWGDQHVRTDPENIVAFHHSCGEAFRPEVRCAACGDVVEPMTIASDRDVHRSDVVAAENHVHADQPV